MLRFGSFNGAWKKRQIVNVCELISGQHLSPDEYVNSPTDTPYFTGPSDFTNSESELSKWSLVHAKVAINNDILITVKGSGVGEMMLLKLPKVAMGRQLMAIRSKAVNDIRFIYFRLSKNKKLYEALASGNMIPGLSRQDILQTKLFIPCHQEQQKIADFLSAVDEKIRLLKEKHALLQQYKKGVMQKLFSQEIRFKDDNGQAFPDWEMRTLSDIAEPIKRRAPEAIDCVMTISAGQGFLHQKDRFSQVIAGTSLDKYTHIRKGEFSYNRGNSKSYTYGCIYKLDTEEEALVPYVYRSFRLKEGNADFYAQLFAFKYLDKQLRRLISSSARMDGLLNIGEKDFYQVRVPFPCLEEQTKIADFLQALDKKLNAVQQQIDLTQTFKKGLLQQMFV
nr:restriction endonuclease subunit S [Alteromonas sp. ASW11-130]